MRLLIATSKRIFLWDGALHALHEGWGTYYGLTWDRERIYVACRGYPHHESVVVFDEDFHFVERLPINGLRDLHQINWRDGKLYVTNTGWNRLEIWDGAKAGPFDYSGVRRDVDHINSVWSDGRLLYIAEHRWAKGSRLRIFDSCLKPVKTIGGVGREIHNVYREDDTLYTCYSPWHCLRAANANGKQWDIRLAKWGYTRGLARTKNRWFVGLSSEAPRHTRHRVNSAVLVLNDKFEIAEMINLEGVGQLLEIRVLDGDLAHNGLPCPFQDRHVRENQVTLNEAIKLLAGGFRLNVEDMLAYAEQDDLGGEYTGWPGGSVPDVDGRILYAIVRASKAEKVLEFGTGHGCATTHVARALHDNGRGVIVTLDKPDSIDLDSYQVPKPYRSHVVRVIEDGLSWIRRNDGKFDLIFEDGPHTFEFTRDAVGLSLPHLTPGGLVLVHDVYGPHEEQVWPGLQAALPNAKRVLAETSRCGLGYWSKTRWL